MNIEHPTLCRRLLVGVLLRLAAALALPPARALAADWPQFHGSNDRTAYNLYEAVLGLGNASAIKAFWRRR
jgi:hypothetical protein